MMSHQVPKSDLKHPRFRGSGVPRMSEPWPGVSAPERLEAWEAEQWANVLAARAARRLIASLGEPPDDRGNAEPDDLGNHRRQ